MEPITILSIVGTALSVTNIVTKAIATLSKLKSRYLNVPLQLSALIGQLHIVHAALDQISIWSSKDLFGDPRYQQLAAQMNTSLDSFRPLIVALEQHLDELDSHGDFDTSAMKKVSFLWNEEEIMTYSSLLDSQVNALSLFLQAVQCKSLADQQRLFNNEDSRTVLQKAKDYSASIVGLSDRSSIFSECTNTNSLGLDFDFDALLLASQAYRSAHRSNLRQLTTGARASGSKSPSRYSTQQRPLPSLQETLRRDSSALKFPDGDLFLSDHGRDQNHCDTSHSSDQDAEQHDQLPKTGSHRICDPFEPPDTAQQSNTAPIPTDSVVVIANFGSNSLREKDIASKVLSPKSTSVNAGFTPKIGLLRLLKKYRRIPTTHHAADSGEIRGPLAATPKTGTTGSPWSPLRKQDFKVLLLGVAESGKSTLLNAVKLYRKGGLAGEERAAYAWVVRSTLIQSIRCILEEMESLNIPLQHERNLRHVQVIFTQAAQFQDEYPNLGEEAAIAIKQLWADAGVQEAFRRRQEYWLMDNVSHFVNDAQRLITPGFIPSEEDTLKCRIRTVGITETRFNLGNGDTIAAVFDVSGVRRERNKWIQVFDNVTDLIFTVDATGYCRRLMEDETVNRMTEQLRIWDATANGHWFTDVNILLMFTKIDLLPETLELSPISHYFPEFEANVDSCGMDQLIDSYLAFLREKFLSILKSEEARQQTQVIHAELVQTGDKSPAGLVLEGLKARSLARK